MADFNEFPHRLVFDRREFRIEPARPAPAATFQPSEKVKIALAEILLKIEAVKLQEPLVEPQETTED